MGQTLIDTFKKELDMIQLKPFQVEVEKILSKLPDYILETPSSSSGKYHPRDEIDNDGMIRHIKRFIIAGNEMVRMYYDIGANYYKYNDLIIATAIMHDVFKQGKDGKGGHTVKQHPIYIYDFLTEYNEKNWSDSHRSLVDEKDLMLFDELRERFNTLRFTCLFHEGRWTIPESYAKYDRKSLTQEQSKAVFLSHLADMIASRRSYYDMMQPDFMDKGENLTFSASIIVPDQLNKNYDMVSAEGIEMIRKNLDNFKPEIHHGRHKGEILYIAMVPKE